MTARLAQINCFWHGPRLRPIEQLCLLSMLSHGNKVRLWTYGAVENVPEGVELAAAGDIIPLEKLLFFRKTNSVSLGADIFRYKLLEGGAGLWLDLDILLLKPFIDSDAPIFGFEDDRFINNAVLKLPPDSSALQDILAFTANPFPLPPYFKWRRRAYLKMRHAIGRPVHVSDLKWGVFGPLCLTHFLKKHGLGPLGAAPDVYYPVTAKQSHRLFMADPQGPLITDNTIAVHLWNETLRKPSKIRPNAPIGRLLVEPGCFVETYARDRLGFRLTSE